jgi:hypothetical protein
MERSRTSARRLLACLAAGSALVAASCGDDDSTGGTSPAAAAAPGSATNPPPRSTAPATTGDIGRPVIDPGDGGDYRPDVDPADFVTGIDNPYLPFTIGSRWVYKGETDGQRERIEVVVTPRTRVVMGIGATVVRDRVFVEGELVEDTFDWYAQDRDGNVWYLGERTQEYEGGKVVSSAGSWEAGVDGALPGIVMAAEPTVGHAYRQEYYAGEAEDMGDVIAVGGSATVAAGTFDDVVTTRDWTPLEPDVIEEKTYAPGVGVVLEAKVAGGDDVVELVAFTPGR